MVSSVYNTPDMAQPHRPRAFALWAFGVFAALATMLGILFLAATPLNDLQAQKFSEAIYSESDTPTPLDIIPGSQKPTSLPYGRCCNHPYAVYTVDLHADKAGLKDPAILMPKIRNNVAVYIDGEWVAGRGRMALPADRYQMWAHLHRLPMDKIQNGKTMEIVVTRRTGRKLLYPFFIGEYDELKPAHDIINLTRVYFPSIHIVISLFVALFCAATASLFRARSLLYSLALLMVFWAGAAAVQILPFSWISGRLNYALYVTFFWSTLAASVCFIMEWTSGFAAPRFKTFWRRLDKPVPADLRRRVWQIAWGLFIVVSAISIYLTATRGASGATLANKAVTWTALLLMPMLGLRLIAYYSNHGKEVIVEAAAFLLVIAAVIVDMIMVRFFDRTGSLVFAASLFFPFALLLSLARRAQSVFEAVMISNTQLNKTVTIAEEKILAGQAELRAHETQTTLLQERSRIMRDMHDGVGGQLVSLLSSVRGGKSKPAVVEQDIQRALNDLRLMIDSLDNVGTSLDTALAIFQERARSRLAAEGIKFSWQNLLDEPAEGFGPEAVLHIYRILQEALTNIQRHAGAKNVSITVEKISGNLPLCITVKDDGRGISDQNSRGRGLDSMKRRAAKLGGELYIELAKPGTILRLLIKEIVLEKN